MALQFQPGQLAGMFRIISGDGGDTFNPGRGGLDQLQQPMPPAQSEPKKPGAFGKGGNGWKILGIIGDALQTAGGGQATYAPAMADLNERIAKEKQAQERLAAEIEQRRIEREQAVADQKALIDYRRENPSQTQLAQNFEYARTQPGMEDLTFPQFMAMYKPQIVGGAETGYYNVAPGAGGLPQGYDPNEWEVVEGDAGGNASGGF